MYSLCIYIYHILYIIYIYIYIYYIYIYIYIYPTVPPGTPGRVRSHCLLSAVFCLIFFLLKGLLLPARFFMRHSFFHAFCIIFSRPIFFQELVPKGLKMGVPKQPKIAKIQQKSRHQNAPVIKAFKKTLSGRGQTSEIDDSYTLFTLFSEGQGSQK